jgi:hypothetical protein
VPSRSTIVAEAEWWAAPGEWKPDAESLVWFFEQAQTEQKPTLADAQKALNAGGTGVKVGGQTKHWCGIFACAVLSSVGVDCRWTLLGGLIKGKGVTGALAHTYPLRATSNQLQPGDIAVIKRYQHHFIVTDVDYGANQVYCVEGNTSGQIIRRAVRAIKYTSAQPLETIDYFYRFKA